MIKNEMKFVKNRQDREDVFDMDMACEWKMEHICMADVLIFDKKRFIIFSKKRLSGSMQGRRGRISAPEMRGGRKCEEKKEKDTAGVCPGFSGGSMSGGMASAGPQVSGGKIQRILPAGGRWSCDMGTAFGRECCVPAGWG
jgi:hypothetical protein